MRRRSLLVIAASACLLTACGPHSSAPSGGGSPTSSTPAPGSAQIVAGSIPPYDSVLTTTKGYAVYVYAPDDAQGVTCTGSCASTWPPLYAKGSPKMIAGPGTQAKLVSTDSDSGRPVVTYNHWPLYTYIGDPGPGYASGEALDLNGGEWYLISPDGQLVKG